MSGSWLGCVKFGDDVVWDWTDEKNGALKKYKPTPHSDPLPSDSRYRGDLIHLHKNNITASQDWKGKLEVRQRKEERGRKEIAKLRSQSGTGEKKGWW